MSINLPHGKDLLNEALANPGTGGVRLKGFTTEARRLEELFNQETESEADKPEEQDPESKA